MRYLVVLASVLCFVGCGGETIDGDTFGESPPDNSQPPQPVAPQNPTNSSGNENTPTPPPTNNGGSQVDVGNNSGGTGTTNNSTPEPSNNNQGNNSVGQGSNSNNQGSGSNNQDSGSNNQGNSLKGNSDPQVIKEGRSQWQAQCEDCHGADGQGGIGFPIPITLDEYATREALVQVVYHTMPPGRGDSPKMACDTACSEATTDFMLAGYPQDESDAPLSCNGSIENHGNVPIRLLTSTQFLELIERVFKKANIQVDDLANSESFMDEMGAGFKNNAGVTVDSNNLENLFDIATKIGDRVANNFAQLKSCAINNSNCARQYINEYGAELFRAQPDAQFVQSLMNLFNQSQGKSGIAQITTAMILSPETLYHYEERVSQRRQLKPREIATRLSFLIWNTTPDKALLDFANSGGLDSDQKIRTQAEKMLRDTRATTGLRNFYENYLKIDTKLSINGMQSPVASVPEGGDQCDTTAQCQSVWPSSNDCKDSRSESSVCMCNGSRCDRLFPLANAQAKSSQANDLPQFSITGEQASDDIMRFVSHLTLQANGNFRDLHESTLAFVDDNAAQIYGVENQQSNGQNYLGGKPVNLDRNERSGLLTRIGHVLHGGGSKVGLSSPTLRGEHVLKAVLCQEPPKAPGDVPFPNLPDTSELTWVDLIKEFHLKDNDNNPATPHPCSECHKAFDPLGFAFENYTLNGEFIAAYPNGKAVDASGMVYGVPGDPNDLDGTFFNNAIEFSSLVANSEHAASCFSKTWLDYALHRDSMLNSGDVCAAEQVAADFKNSGYSLKALILAIVKNPSFRFRNPDSQ